MFIDNFNRIHNYLRVSLTDKCNLNCFYCNPSGNGNINKSNDILSYEELVKILRLFVRNGIDKIRFTGGEPLVRKDVDKFFNFIAADSEFSDTTLGITTNGILIDKFINELENANISNINISLDSLQRDNFKKIAGHDKLDQVISNIELLLSRKFANIKINVVSAKNVNDTEINEFVNFAVDRDLNLRFIEYMPFSNNGWNNAQFIPADEIIDTIKFKYNVVELPKENSITRDFIISGTNAKISTISPISEHFCASCNRLRLTSTGKLKLCLFSDNNNSLDLKSLSDLDNYSINNEINDFLSKKSFSHPEIEDLIQLSNINMLSIGG